MKKYIQYLSVAVAALLLCACEKMAPSKAEVEAGFEALSALPTLSISGNPTCDAINGIVSVPVSVSGLTSDMKDLSIGIMTSQDPTFASSKFIAVENPTNGNVTMNGSVTANNTFYVKAVAASPKGGTVFSNVITVNVPDIPLYYKVPGKYTGHAVSEAYGDEYDNVLTIVADEEDPQHLCRIYGIEPYYQNAGHDLDKGENYVEAIIDEASNSLIIPIGAEIHYEGRSVAGLNSSSMSEATAFDSIKLKLTGSGDLYRFEAFYTLTPAGEAEDAYAGDITYKRN